MHYAYAIVYEGADPNDDESFRSDDLWQTTLHLAAGHAEAEVGTDDTNR